MTTQILKLILNHIELNLDTKLINHHSPPEHRYYIIRNKQQLSVGYYYPADQYITPAPWRQSHWPHCRRLYLSDPDFLNKLHQATSSFAFPCT